MPMFDGDVRPLHPAEVEILKHRIKNHFKDRYLLDSGLRAEWDIQRKIDEILMDINHNNE